MMTAAFAVPVILYIDDEPMLCRVFQRILEDAGARVVTFTDPELALAFARANPIGAIVSDYRMPTLNGLEVLDQIEGEIPFFLVSGDIAISSLVQRHPRITHVLAKPFQPETLLTLLRPYLPLTPRG